MYVHMGITCYKHILTCASIFLYNMDILNKMPLSSSPFSPTFSPLPFYTQEQNKTGEIYSSWLLVVKHSCWREGEEEKKKKGKEERKKAAEKLAST